MEEVAFEGLLAWEVIEMIGPLWIGSSPTGLPEPEGGSTPPHQRRLT